MTDDVTALSLPNRVVLLGLASLETTGSAPAHAPAVRRACRSYADELADTVVGTLDEATVARSLNELEAKGYADRVDDGETSAVGKGRPAFALDAPTADVLNALEAEDALAAAATAVRDD
jgi:predicted ArsR family transcriptional regulator